MHNIGAADAADVEIVLVDAAKKIISRRHLGPLAAPLDLTPKRLDFSLPLPAGLRPGWKVVVDPENQVPEISEANNET